ncbi:PucR family transcriptional regulator [Clostridium sp. P21]|uniref:PucR family transcriptional regulator n=1 Tax=Clostridium muellerianum TaxID=2716538 RepID=A0A7Y0EJP2_9CLOT|nr:helix-turn-helix domain-containing protein [Clostridium muellerianum]NMM64627.1 PucR family transcriptional regulator [Clostridium muellerianum]
MKLNAYIIKDYVSFPIIKSFLNSSPLDCNLERVTVYHQDKTLQSSDLVLIKLDELIALSNSEQDGAYICLGYDKSIELYKNMDIIFVTPEFNPLEIMEKLQDTFNLFSNWEKNLLELLANNAPLKEIGEAALPFINNPIGIYTSGLRNVFFCERKKARNLMLYSEEDINKYLSPEEIDELKFNSEFISTIDAVEPTLFSAEMWGFRILFYNIRICDIYVARVVISETERPFRVSDSPLLKFLSSILEVSMVKQDFPMNDHPKDFETMINQLLDKQNVDELKLQRILQYKNWNITDCYFCIAIEVSTYDQVIHTVSTIGSILEANIPGSIALEQKDYILAIVNLNAEFKTRDELLSVLVYILREGLLKAGISEEFHNFKNLNEYYLQACDAIRIGSIYDETIWCYRYEQYALKRLILRAAAESNIEALCPQGLNRLMDYDKKHKRQYTKTLKIYLQNNLSVAKTIRHLYVQRATFLYQLKRILQISELDLDDPKVKLHLLIVFEIMEERKLILKFKEHPFQI